MLFNNFLKNRKLSKVNALDLIPQQLVEYKLDDKNLVILLVLRFRSRFLNHLFNKSDYFNVRLDELGSKTWLLIDGKKNIEQICNQLSIDTMSFDEATIRVTTFITDLYRKELVTFKIL